MKTTIRPLLVFLFIIPLFFTGCKENTGEEISVGNYTRGIYLSCVNGYVFAVYSGYNSGGITQVWEIGEDGLPRPQLCPPSTDMKKFIWE